MQLVRIIQLIREDNLVKFYQCKEWRGKGGLRDQALKRDNYECQECKRQGRVKSTRYLTRGNDPDDTEDDIKITLHVHHLKEVKQYPQLALVLNNLETLCVKCHNDYHDRLADVNAKRVKFTNEERW